jgi:hypothetical protein
MSDFKNPSTDSSSSTPTLLSGAITANWTTNTTLSQKLYLQNGNWMYGTLKVALSGQPDNVQLTINLTSTGYKLDPQYSGTISIVCTSHCFDTSVPNAYQVAGCKVAASDVSIEFYTQSVNPVGSALVLQNPVNRTAPMTWATGDYMIVTFGMFVVSV